MYSILHISDLHRSTEDSISNDELISSLRADRFRYVSEEPSIRLPDAIIVSGDIIQGVQLNTKNYLEELNNQYVVAEDFLVRLCDEFLDGDRSKLIIVPGNHDVDWNTARQAMQEVPLESEPRLNQAFREDGIYRWDWKSKTFYQITDKKLYAKRMDPFWSFAERFYANSPGILKFSKNADFNLFELHSGRIVVAAFNSCHGNDCFASHGYINPQAISECHLTIGSLQKPFELWLSVWHHNIEGPPYRTDYMDINIIKNMIGRGFRVGLFGHQHRNQAEPHHIFLPDKETMAIISAGSLCAGSNELPTGCYRQYNIIEFSENLQSLRVHVRQMETAQLFSKAHISGVGGLSYVDMEWQQPKETVRKLHLEKQSFNSDAVLEAEKFLKTNQSDKAVTILEATVHQLGVYGRSIFFDAAVKIKRWDLVIKYGLPPQSIDELTTLIEAYDQTYQIDIAKSTLNHYAPLVNLPEACARDLHQRLLTREMQKK